MSAEMRELERLSETLKVRTAEIGKQIGQSTASQGTTADLIVKIAELKARVSRSAALFGVPDDVTAHPDAAPVGDASRPTET
jgi:hypothetical protein